MSMIRTIDFRNEPWDLGDGVIAEMKDGESETGSIEGRVHIVLATPPEAPTVISFLRGGTSATIEGSAGSRGTVDSRRGQGVTITVAKSRSGIVSRPVVLKLGITVLATVNAGDVTKVSLPATGRFTLQVDGNDPVGYSSAELSIR